MNHLNNLNALVASLEQQYQNYENCFNSAGARNDLIDLKMKVEKLIKDIDSKSSEFISCGVSGKTGSINLGARSLLGRIEVKMGKLPETSWLEVITNYFYPKDGGKRVTDDEACCRLK